MSNVAAHASMFFRDVKKYEMVYTIRDQGGFPAPKASSGKRSQPFWSSRSRAEKIVNSIPAYRQFEVVEISIETFIADLLPGLLDAGLLVGVNWSGKHAKGYDMEPERVLTLLRD